MIQFRRATLVDAFPIFTVLSGIVMVGALSGCQATEQIAAQFPNGPRQLVPVAGEYVAGSPLGIDVQNARGTVTIMSDSEVEAPIVRALVRKPSGSTGKDIAASWAAAQVSTEEGRSILRVLCADPLHVSEHVDLVIRVPSMAGVRVRNTAGAVIVRGAAGALDIQNGSPVTAGGDVDVAADALLKDPVLLSTPRGSVMLRAFRGMSGKLHAQTGSGMVRVSPRETLASNISASPSSWTGKLGDGEADVRVESGDGDVTVTINH